MDWSLTIQSGTGGISSGDVSCDHSNLVDDQYLFSRRCAITRDRIHCARESLGGVCC